MKTIVLGLVFLFLTTPTFAQQIENIRAVATRDTILITYDLVGGLADQLYKISASCWDGIEKTELKSIQGRTVVKPGRNQQFRWQVLDDMELLAGDSITFTLVASEYTPPVRPGFDRSLKPDDQKAFLLVDLKSQVDTYLNEVLNQATYLRDYTEGGIFANPSALSRLNTQRDQLNLAYNLLLKNRRSFEMNISKLWNEKAKMEADSFFKEILDQMHPLYVLRLNEEVMKKMNDYTTFNRPGYRSKKLLTEIKENIFSLADPLIDTQLTNARKNSQALYVRLKP